MWVSVERTERTDRHRRCGGIAVRGRRTVLVPPMRLVWCCCCCCCCCWSVAVQSLQRVKQSSELQCASRIRNDEYRWQSQYGEDTWLVECLQRTEQPTAGCPFRIVSRDTLAAHTLTLNHRHSTLIHTTDPRGRSRCLRSLRPQPLYHCIFRTIKYSLSVHRHFFSCHNSTAYQAATSLSNDCVCLHAS